MVEEWGLPIPNQKKPKLSIEKFFSEKKDIKLIPPKKSPKRKRIKPKHKNDKLATEKKIDSDDVIFIVDEDLYLSPCRTPPGTKKSQSTPPITPGVSVDSVAQQPITTGKPPTPKTRNMSTKFDDKKISDLMIMDKTDKSFLVSLGKLKGSNT
jgi:hypothetical protein